MLPHDILCGSIFCFILKDMKIKLSELRRIIRETIRDMEEDTVPPGKWSAYSVDPVGPEDLERLGEEEDDVDEGGRW